jgi:hypothetical protein
MEKEQKERKEAKEAKEGGRMEEENDQNEETGLQLRSGKTMLATAEAAGKSQDKPAR